MFGECKIYCTDSSRRVQRKFQISHNFKYPKRIEHLIKSCCNVKYNNNNKIMIFKHCFTGTMNYLISYKSISYETYYTNNECK